MNLCPVNVCFKNGESSTIYSFTLSEQYLPACFFVCVCGMDILQLLFAAFLKGEGKVFLGTCKGNQARTQMWLTETERTTCCPLNCPNKDSLQFLHRTLWAGHLQHGNIGCWHINALLCHDAHATLIYFPIRFLFLQEIADKDGNNKVLSFTIPSLSKPSIYHEVRVQSCIAKGAEFLIKLSRIQLLRERLLSFKPSLLQSEMILVPAH